MDSIGESIRILSANLMGSRDLYKRTDQINYLKSLNPNILCVQDTHWVENDQPEIRKIWDGETIIKW